MQVTIVGKFKSGSGENSIIGTDFFLGNQSTNISWVADIRQIIENMDACVETDLLVCGPEINVEKLSASLQALGISSPMIIQPTQTANATTDAHNPALVGTRLSSENDPSAWLGNESNPLRLGRRLCDMERSMILQTLTHCGGNRTYAADILGISSRTLRTKLQQYSAEGCTIKAAPQRQSSTVTHMPVSTLLS
jgi:two-component system response regulator FlrC